MTDDDCPFLRWEALRALGPEGRRALGDEEATLVLGGVLHRVGDDWEMRRLQSAELTGLSTLHAALDASPGDDAVAVLDLNEDCGIVLRRTGGRDRWFVSHPAECWYFTLVWEAVDALDPQAATIEYDLPHGDATVLADWGVAASTLDGALTADLMGDEFVDVLLTALGVRVQFNALFAHDR